MPVPKKRSSRSVQGMRRSHDHLNATQATQECPNCGNWMQRHHVCPHCNFYRGRAIFPDADKGATGQG